jgi:cysteine synthase A
MGYGLIPPLWRGELCDGFLKVTDGQAIDAARRLAVEEGLLTGFSSGANVAAALKVAQRLPKGAVVVTVMPDSGLRYLSTDLFSGRRNPRPG